MSHQTEDLSFMVNHVFFPPKLPQKDDMDEDGWKEYTLCSLTYRFAKSYRRLLPATQRVRWDPILRMLENIRSSHESSKLSVENITQCMEGMESGGKMFSSAVSII
jgi:hypothetical protein